MNQKDKLEEALINVLKLTENRDETEIPYGVQYGFDRAVEILDLNKNDDYFNLGGICRFENCSIDKLNKLLNDTDTKDTINLNSRHNDSPTIDQFKQFMLDNKNHNYELEGYLVMPYRDDYEDNDRFQVDGINIDGQDEEGIKLLDEWINKLVNGKKIYYPSEFDTYGSIFRAWWD